MYLQNSLSLWELQQIKDMLYVRELIKNPEQVATIAYLF